MVAQNRESSGYVHIEPGRTSVQQVREKLCLRRQIYAQEGVNLQVGRVLDGYLEFGYCQEESRDAQGQDCDSCA